MIRALTALAIVVLPVAAEACATCIGSPFGDRTYNWPYLALIVLPFALGAVIAGVFMRVAGVGPRALVAACLRLVHPTAPHKETT